MSEMVGFELIDIKQEIQNCVDLEAITDQLHKADMLLIQCGSFSDGKMVESISTLNKTVAFWSLPEPSNDGDIKLHSLITQVLFASIYNKRLNKSGEYTTLMGNSSSQEFTEKFVDVVLALKAIKNLSNAKICQIGKEADGFLNLKEDEKNLASTFKINISKLQVEDVVNLAKSFGENEVKEELDRLMQRDLKVIVSNSKLVRTIRVYLALRQIAQENHYAGLAVSCWPEFQERYEMVPCLAFSMLVENDDVCVSCEGDLGGVLSMMILRELSQDKPSLMDFTQIDFSKEAVQLWHCGFSPMSYAGGSSRLIDHPMLNRKMSIETHMGVAQDFEIDAKEITFLRITGKEHHIFAVSGQKTKDVNQGFTGVRIWLDKLQTTFGSVTVEQVVDTILTNGIEHHYAICRKNVLNRVKYFSQFAQLQLVRWDK